MDQKLQEKLQLLQDVVENIPVPVGVYLGEELKIVLANDAMIKTYGKGTWVLGKRYIEILPGLESQEIFAQALAVLKTGIPFYAKNTRVNIMINGVLKPHYFDYSFTPLKDSNGVIYAVMNMGSDVTELCLARQQVKEAEEKLRFAMSSAGLATYEADLINNKITTSEKFHTIWGTDGIVDKENIIQKIHPDDLNIRDKAHEEAILTDTMCYEVRISPAKGMLRWVRIKGNIIKDKTGSPIRLLGIVQDITEQKEFSEELKKLVAEQTSELKRSNEDLLQFANIVSHDLKEPIRKISIFNTMLRKDLSDNLGEKNAGYFDKVQISTQRIASIIDGVLNYSMLNKSSQVVQIIDLNKVVEGIKTDLELIIQEKQAILLKDDFPEIEGAPILIHQLFYNLIHNALKFSRPDNPPRVTISCFYTIHDTKEHIRISIKDNGIGFDSKHARTIFNAFERLHSKDEFEGTGLGLALCKKIVERHHGTIEASADKNSGAEFIIILPLKQYTNTI